MKTILLALTLSTALMALGDKEGHGGDPYVADFYKRGQFVLNEMRMRLPIERALIVKFAMAYRDLRVEPSETSLSHVGRVVRDFERPGKWYVVLDRTKYREVFEKKSAVDLNAFVAHEIFETAELDYAYEISRRLRFSESLYLRWYAGYAGKSTPSSNPYDRYAAMAYSYETGLGGIAWDHQTSNDAEAGAFSECRAVDCQVVLWVRNGCGGIARSLADPTIACWAWADNRKVAEKNAMDCCRKQAGDCVAHQSVCSSTAKP